MTREGLLTLFAGLDVFPDIYRYLKALGRKSFSRDEGFAGFDSITTLDESGKWASFGT